MGNDFADALDAVGHAPLLNVAPKMAVFRVTSWCALGRHPLARTASNTSQRWYSCCPARKLNATGWKSNKAQGWHSVVDGTWVPSKRSFDIAFVDRMDDNASCGSPTREMERLLNRYQDAGIIYVITGKRHGGWVHAHHVLAARCTPILQSEFDACLIQIVRAHTGASAGSSPSPHSLASTPVVPTWPSKTGDPKRSVAFFHAMHVHVIGTTPR